MKKIFALILAGVIMTSVMAGCQKKPVDTENPDVPGTTDPGTPGTDTPDTPDTDTPETPDTDTPETPDTDTPETPDNVDKPDATTATLEDILAYLYATSKIEEGEYANTTVIDKSLYTDNPETYDFLMYTAFGGAQETLPAFDAAILSAPMNSSIPYQLVLARFADGTDIDAVKQLLNDNADPRKWICVCADAVVVENVGNVVLFAYCDTAGAEALTSALNSLA